jgi:nicotinamidase/pyrazinamidase
MKALLLVDIQNDFLPGGALAVRRGDEVISTANRMMPNYDLVVASQDWHPANHGSFASQHPGKGVGDVVQLEGLSQVLWPNHCVQGTHGANFPQTLNRFRIDHIIRKGTWPSIDSYSAFFDNARRKATGLADYLRSFEIDEVHIMGLATDYCVRATALDAVDLGFRTVLLRDGVRGVELKEGDCQRAIGQMRAAGVKIKSTKQLWPENPVGSPSRTQRARWSDRTASPNQNLAKW